MILECPRMFCRRKVFRERSSNPKHAAWFGLQSRAQKQGLQLGRAELDASHTTLGDVHPDHKRSHHNFWVLRFHTAWLRPSCPMSSATAAALNSDFRTAATPTSRTAPRSPHQGGEILRQEPKVVTNGWAEGVHDDVKAGSHDTSSRRRFVRRVEEPDEGDILIYYIDIYIYIYGLDVR